MNKVIRFGIFTVLILSVVGLTGCTRSYSKAPKQTPVDQMLVIATVAPVEEAAPVEQALLPAVATEAPPAAEPQGPSEPPIVIPTLQRPDTYVLQKGEWPICIARRYDLNIGDLFALNGLTLDSRPGAGVTLRIPSEGTWSASQHGSRSLRNHSSYTVKTGDTIGSIACYFGDVSPEGILAANRMSSAGDIQVGMSLDIP